MVTSARHSLAQGCMQLCSDQAAISGAGERTCHFIRRSPRGGQMPLDRAAGHSRLPCSVGKGPFLTYLWQLRRFFWEPSQAFLSFGNWPKRRNSLNFYSWVKQSPKVSWVSVGRGEVRPRATRAYSVTSYLKQRACVRNCQLMKSNGSDKGIR